MTANQLLKAALNRKCVVGALPINIPLPAAFVVNMQFWRVAQRLPQMKLYKRKTKVKPGRDI